MRSHFWIALFVVVSITCTANAGEYAELHVRGQLGKGALQLEILPGNVEADAVLVFAQPSGKLLAAAFDTNYLETPEGNALRANLPSAQALVEGDLSTINPSMLLPLESVPREMTLQVLLYGSYADIELDGVEVIHSRVLVEDGEPFGVAARLEQSEDGNLLLSTCCYCGGVFCGCSDCVTTCCDCVQCRMSCGSCEIGGG